MSVSISNVEIERFIEENGDDLKRSFAGVVASNNISCFISFHSLIRERYAKYSFMISNKNRSDKGGTQWWSILDPHPKKEMFLFDSFGLMGVQNFII